MLELPSILAKIIRRKRLRLEQAMRERPLAELKAAVRDLPLPRDFRAALSRDEGVAVIAELKRRSPSKGLLREDFDLEQIQRAYEEGGADAYSVLTEEEFFSGSLRDLQRLRKLTGCPILRKDFLLEPYQLYEARDGGADAVLLIAAALSPSKLRELLDLSGKLGMAALVEVHNAGELHRVPEEAPIIGINNRDLRSFRVSLEVSLELKALLPADKLVVSESGIQGPEDVCRLAAAGIRAFLVGEHLIRSQDPASALKKLKSALEARKGAL